MVYMIGLTQFIFATLGLMGLTIIVNSLGGGQEASPFAAFLVRYGLIIILLPVVWVAYATVCEQVNKLILSSKLAQVIGVTLAAVIFFSYGFAILYPSN